MASADSDEAKITSDFPSPPIYYKAIDADATVLAPPKIPNDGRFLLFGELRKLEETSPTLADQGFQTLFDPNGDSKAELKKLVGLARSKFAALVNALSNDVENQVLDVKVDDLNLCFVNMLYLVNELRADQAKATLKAMLAKQVEAKGEAARLLDTVCEDTAQRINDAFSQLSTSSLQNDVKMDEGLATRACISEEGNAEVIDSVIKRMRQTGS